MSHQADKNGSNIPHTSGTPESSPASGQHRVHPSRRYAAYRLRALLALVLVCCLLLALNVGAQLLPNRITRRDVSSSVMTHISEETRSFLRRLDRDVTLYWLCENGNTDIQMDVFLSRYADESLNILIEVLDPLTDPDFSEAYARGVVGNYSVLVQSDLRNTVVDSNDLYVYTNDYADQIYQSRTQMTYSEINTFYQQFYSAYGHYPEESSTHLYFRGESLLTAAIDYVTAPSIPHGYLLSGHNPEALPSKLEEMLEAYDLTPASLDLEAAEAVPEDANCVILYAPQQDLSANEQAKLEAYIDRGGSLLLVTDPDILQACPRVASLGQRFGLSGQAGIAIENDSTRTAGSVYQILPIPNQNQPVSYMLSNNDIHVQIPQAHGIAIASPLPDGVSALPMLSTSASGNRLSTDGYQTALEPKNKNVHLAVSASRQVSLPDGTSAQAQMVWFGSTRAFEDDLLVTASYGNGFYLTISLAYMSPAFSSAYEQLSPVEMQGSVMSQLPMGAAIFWIVFTVVLVPAGLLITGVVIRVRRRRR